MIKKFDEFDINEAYNAEGNGRIPYIDYIVKNYKHYGEFENAKNGYLEFSFSTYEEQQNFAKKYMPLGYENAFSYSKGNQGEGEYFVTVNLKKLEECIANVYMPAIVDSMFKNFGLK